MIGIWGFADASQKVFCFSKAEGTEFVPSVSLAGVLLDIQQHFGVKDSGAGLLQTGKSICFLAGFCNLPLLRKVRSDFFSYSPWARWLWNTLLLGRCANVRGFLALICWWAGDQGSEWPECRMGQKQTNLMLLFMTAKFVSELAASPRSENSWQTNGRILLFSLLLTLCGLVISVMYEALHVLHRESAECTVIGSTVWHENVKLIRTSTRGWKLQERLTIIAFMVAHGLTISLWFWCC